MSFTTYTLKNNKVIRNNETISLEEARVELDSFKFSKLKKEKEIRVNMEKLKAKKDKKQSTKKIKVAKQIKVKQLPDDKLFDKYQEDYKISKHPYHGSFRMGIERKNKKYGYWNFVSYIDSEHEFKEIVIKDIKEQLNIQKENKKIKVMEDDDI